MKKIIVVASVLLFLFCPLFVSPLNAGTGTMNYANLRENLKFRIGEYTPDMTNALYDSCILMAANACRIHGLARYLEASFDYDTLEVERQHFTTGMRMLFIASLCKVSEGDNTQEKAIPEIRIKDVGHKMLVTDEPHSFFFFYYDQDTPYVFIYPMKTDTLNWLIFSYFEGYDYDLAGVGKIVAAYKEALLNYAAMLVWLRLENYQRAAESYNNYQMEIVQLREERVNWIPDISIEQKTLK